MDSKDIGEVRKLTDQVDGWLGKREGPYLYSLAKIGSKLGAVVEIGSWKGKSTIWLAKGSQAVNGGKVYAIDPHMGCPDQEMQRLINIPTEEQFRQNIKKASVESVVVTLVKASMEAVVTWQEPIGLLWIDGDHRYEAVRSDFYGWVPHVVDMGIIALHDTYSREGVRKVVDDSILKDDRFRVMGQMDGILAVEKVQSLSHRDRLQRSLIRGLRRIYNDARARRKHWRTLPRKLLRGLSAPEPGS